MVVVIILVLTVTAAEGSVLSGNLDLNEGIEPFDEPVDNLGALASRETSESSFDSPFLTMTPTSTASDPGWSRASVIGLGIGIALLVVIICCVILFILCRRQKRRQADTDDSWHDPLKYTIDSELVDA
jgi:hypothetical protein